MTSFNVGLKFYFLQVKFHGEISQWYWLHHWVQNPKIIKYNKRHAQIRVQGEELQALEVQTMKLWKSGDVKNNFEQMISDGAVMSIIILSTQNDHLSYFTCRHQCLYEDDSAPRSLKKKRQKTINWCHIAPLRGHHFSDAIAEEPCGALQGSHVKK